MRAHVWRTASAAISAALLVAACREDALRPDLPIEPDEASMDSAEMRSRAGTGTRPIGLFLAPVASDSLVLAGETDSFQITLVSRDCVAPSNEVVALSLEDSLLSATMCQQTVPTMWSFEGPYSAGTSIVLEFTSGAFGGSIDGQIQVNGSFPSWTLNFEDATDNDFNDFVLDVDAFVADTSFSISLTADTTELHPWIPEWVQQLDNGAVDQDLRFGDTAIVTLTAAFAGVPVDSQSVTFTAEFLPRTGGHHHLDDRLLFSNAPTVPEGVGAGNAGGQPVTGYFKQGSVRTATLSDTTDANGEIAFVFVAGFVAGDIVMTATTEYADSTFTDSLAFRVRVPGLTDLESTTVVDEYAYLIGQFPYPPLSPSDTTHARDSIWYARSAFGDVLESFAQAMVRDSAEVTYYLQVNDASLPFGGTFSVYPDTTSTDQLVDRPYDRGHRRSHNSGVDVDVSWCQVPLTGDQGQADRISGTNCAAQGVAGVSHERLIDAASRLGLIVLREANPPHYHLRLAEEP